MYNASKKLQVYRCCSKLQGVVKKK